MTISRAEGAQVLRKVLSFTFGLWGRRRALVAGIALSMSLATLTEVFVPVYAGRLIDAVTSGATDAALSAFLTMVVLGLMLVLLRHLAWWGVVPLTLGLMTSVARDTFHRVQRLSTDWHANSFAGSIVRKITRGMWALDTLDDVLLLYLLPSAVVLIGTVVLLGAHWPLMGVVMAIGSAAYVTFSIVVATRIIAPASRLSNAQDTKIGGVLADALSSNAVVKAFGAEQREDARLARVVDKWRRRTSRTWMRHTWSGSTQLALLWAIRTSITGVALWLWSQGKATPGEITYVLTTYFVVHGYLREIGQHVHQLQRSVNEMEEMVRLYDEPLGVADAPGAAPLRITNGEVRFEHVTFSYAGHHQPLYRDLNVRIAGGQRIGLVGHSGSGKTTFVKLIQRLYDVKSGHVLIDGQDVAHATQESLRSQIAIVPQEPILFHRSLAENIAYAKPDATQAQIERAARLANAHDFIARLPRGYQTLVGERGIKLSGGERQRVALARAFLADAPILILDEATSSLDSESEALIQEAMERLMRGRTSIIIAHRLSTVRAVDRILVFEQGRIIEDGNHETLLRQSHGHYRRLFERQSGAFVAPAEMID
ncbi:MAG TPA: ABC transporter ATP-binding protein [Povalibacter sp.]|uniref:ABC transporter ATP-binding protein n=1 Tax=Povalibacter sp. TaxID=1962978 RepID=UPI002D15D416|nr:ABC transporter ATP-binding protein [Povalibacter sp.]HMN43886.1 ABC transporter ATP-binding protein [Povalibacter sp.]